MELFPALFTIFCFVVFIIPIWLTYHIGQDDQVQQWITQWAWIVLFLPLLYLGTHVYHVLHGVPNKILVLACLLGSSTLILILADVVLLQAFHKGNEFGAKDCNSFAAKRDMEIQYQNAKKFFSTCVIKLSKEHGITVQAAVGQYRLNDCSNYASLEANNTGWPYLARLEEVHSCGGWCTRGQPLWTFKTVQDSCSSAVADVMHNKVRWSMMQVVVYSLIAFGFVAAMLLNAAPLLQKHGIEW